MAESHSQIIPPLDDDPFVLDPDPSLISDELKPTTPGQRTYSGWEMASLWVGLVVGVPSFYLAGSLVELGMSWWQGVATVVAANIITVITLILAGHPGTRYGIPFPVVARAAFGVSGAHIPTLLRALVACGWYGIETWIGGQAIFILLPKTIKGSSFSQNVSWLGTSVIEFTCFIVFWVVQLASVFFGINGIRKLENYSAPILVALVVWLFIWSYVKAGGFGPMLSLPSTLSSSQFWSLFFPSLTANIGSWATLALNIPDFTRYAKSQTDQAIGQAGLPIFMGLMSFVGLAVTSSTELIFGHVISNPIELLAEIDGGFLTVIIAIFGISLATITTNVAANIVAPANALINLCPSRFTFRRGAVVTALLGIGFQPWRLMQSSESFLNTWLVGYSVFVGPVGGIILADYYLVKGMDLRVKDLYSRSPYGAYYYCGGYNLVAIMALVIGVLPGIPGFLQSVGILKSIPSFFTAIYDIAWFFGLFSAGAFYWFLSFLEEKCINHQPLDPLLPNSS
nr:purine-uracil permease NCS1 [Ipomoea batatas]